MNLKRSEQRQTGVRGCRSSGLLENALALWKANPDPKTRIEMLKCFHLASDENLEVYVLTLKEEETAQDNSLWNTRVSMHGEISSNMVLYPAAFQEKGVVYIAFLSEKEALRYTRRRPDTGYVQISLNKLISLLLEQSDLEGLYINSATDASLLLPDELHYIIDHSGSEFKSSSIQGELMVRQGDLEKLGTEAIVEFWISDRPLSTFNNEDTYTSLDANRPGMINVEEDKKNVPRYRFSVCTPTYDPMDGNLSLGACYWNALDKARDMDLDSIALPLIGYSETGYPMEEAASLALQICSAWLSRNHTVDLKIILAAADENEFKTYHRMAHQIFSSDYEPEHENLSS